MQISSRYCLPFGSSFDLKKVENGAVCLEIAGRISHANMTFTILEEFLGQANIHMYFLFY